MSKYVVEQGESMNSIAAKTGFFWETLWNHPQNVQLKQKRKDPNILFPADEVYVPEQQMKEETGATETRHRFRRKGVPAKLRLHLMRDKKPLANEPYILEVDGVVLTRGTTDGNGQIDQSIPLDAQKGRLILGDEEYSLYIGCLDPVSELSGVQQRLNNLGFNAGPEDGVMNSQTQAAISAFQQTHSVPSTGKLDSQTRDLIEKEYNF